tara:strand:+ start:1854 stop:2228 length:375 start_codon:yes stop_codon:yes gene_type:complete
MVLGLIVFGTIIAIGLRRDNGPTEPNRPASPSIWTETPIGYSTRLHGVVESAKNIEQGRIKIGRVKITLLDDAECLHEFILVGRAESFHVGEYNEIILSRVGPQSWGSVEEVFLGEGAIESLQR